MRGEKLTRILSEEKMVEVRMDGCAVYLVRLTENLWFQKVMDLRFCRGAVNLEFEIPDLTLQTPTELTGSPPVWHINKGQLMGLFIYIIFFATSVIIRYVLLDAWLVII
jgi:hypothetical protein